MPVSKIAVPVTSDARKAREQVQQTCESDELRGLGRAARIWLWRRKLQYQLSRTSPEAHRSREFTSHDLALEQWANDLTSTYVSAQSSAPALSRDVGLRATSA
jgi:hypothetical protein